MVIFYTLIRPLLKWRNYLLFNTLIVCVTQIVYIQLYARVYSFAQCVCVYVNSTFKKVIFGILNVQYNKKGKKKIA